MTEIIFGGSNMQIRLGSRRYVLASRQRWQLMAVSWLVSFAAFFMLIWFFCEYEDIA